MLVFAGDDQRVEEVERRRLDANDRLARSGLRCCDVAEFKFVRGAESFAEDRFHEPSFRARAAGRNPYQASVTPASSRKRRKREKASRKRDFTVPSGSRKRCAIVECDSPSKNASFTSANCSCGRTSSAARTRSSRWAAAT